MFKHGAAGDEIELIPSGIVLASGMSILRPKSVASFVLGTRPGDTATMVHSGR